MTDLPIMRASFRTTVSGGGKYEMVFRFPTMEAMHAADDEWRTALSRPTPAEAGEAVIIHLDRALGRYGAAYDPPGPRRAYTSKHQPGNGGAWSIGQAVNLAMQDSAGDYIDRGLTFLRHLHEKGFGVFEIERAEIAALATTDAAQGQGEGT